jgi:predicted phosphodiesterase
MKMFNLKIGLISDTLDNIQIIQNTISLFNYKHANFVNHAGDTVSTEAVERYGYNDIDIDELPIFHIIEKVDIA